MLEQNLTHVLPLLGSTTKLSILCYVDVMGNEAINAVLNDSASESGILFCGVYTYQWHDFLTQWDSERNYHIEQISYCGEMFICGIRNL